MSTVYRENTVRWLTFYLLEVDCVVGKMWVAY
jgi:hypothetical protein